MIKTNPWAGLLLGLLSLQLAATAIAQEGSSTDDEAVADLVVQASRLDQTTYEMGSSVHVISAEQLQLLGYDFALDAIAAAPGVTINQNGPYGGSGSVRIRGASSEQTLMLVDGIVVNDPSSPGGGFNFARLDAENIERIEILKGPQSTLWGGDAIGGVVSVITKQPQDGVAASLFAEAGSFGSRRGGIEASAANTVADIRLAVQRSNSEGISKADEANGNREDDSYAATTINLQGNLNLPQDAALNLSLMSTDAEAEFDGFAAAAQGNVGDSDELSETEELTGQVSLALPLFDGRLENTLVAGYSNIERDNFSNGAASFSAEGERKIYRYQGRLDLHQAHRLGFGAEREETKNQTTNSATDSLYGLYEFRPLAALTLTFGLRSDDIDQVGRETTGRAALAYQLADTITLRGSWGEGFKAPTIFQTTFFCCGATAPTTNLQAEVSEAFDLGLDWHSVDGAHYLSATYFSQDTENLITFSFTGGGYENIAETEASGIELGFGYTINPWLRLDGSYGYTDITDHLGEALIRVPEHSGDLQFTMTPLEKLNLTLLARYNGKEPDIGGEVADWWRLDLAAKYTLAQQLDVFMRVENLLDEEYQQILGYGTAGLSASVGMRYRF